MSTQSIFRFQSTLKKRSRICVHEFDESFYLNFLWCSSKTTYYNYFGHFHSLFLDKIVCISLFHKFFLSCRNKRFLKIGLGLVKSNVQHVGQTNFFLTLDVF